MSQALKDALQLLAQEWNAEADELRERMGDALIVDDYGELWPDEMCHATYATLKRCSEALRELLTREEGKAWK